MPIGRGHRHEAHHGHHLGVVAHADSAARRRALLIALVANAAFLVVQIVAGLAADSLALLADSVHMLSDVAALLIALFALRLAVVPASARHTYGLVRAEVLSGLINAVMLVGASIVIVVEALGRLDTPREVDGALVMLVAAVGFLVNGVSAWVVGRVSGRNLNLRGAFWHLAADALGSLGVLVAGIAVVVWDADWADAAVSLGIVALIAVSAIGLIREATAVLLESTPAGIVLGEVEAAIAESPGVAAVHHTHAWSLGSETTALSTHVVLRGEPSLHDAQLRGDELKHLLAERFGIRHATIELECHDCADEFEPLHPRGAGSDHA